ncbi:MAG: antibiotic biosynthesis monooxygenase [Pseudomonadota bacterium]
MIGVIFEVWPKPEFKDKYLELAAELKGTLEAIKGFESVERFQSIYDDNKMLSLSFFASHEALDEWRNVAEHRVAQKVGRSRYFADYRLRVVEVLRDYGMEQRDQAPADSLRTLDKASAS